MLTRLSYFNHYFFCHKWNGAWSLLIETVYTSCIISYQTTEGLESQEMRKFQEILKTTSNYNLVAGHPPNIKFLPLWVKHCQKLDAKIFPWCTICMKSKVCLIYCPWFSLKTAFCLAPGFFKRESFEHFCNLKACNPILSQNKTDWVAKKCWDLPFLITTFSNSSCISKFGIERPWSLVWDDFSER